MTGDVNKLLESLPDRTSALLVACQRLEGAWMSSLGIRLLTWGTPPLDIREKARALASSIETAHQFREHANNRIEDKAEFDLRLAEAEAAMRRYAEVFNDREFQFFSKVS
jgi:hypothetical protein